MDYDFGAQTIFDIMPGNHVLLSDLVVENVYNVTMIGSSEVVTNWSQAKYGFQMDNNLSMNISFRMSTSVINCASFAGLVFSNITNLSLINLTLINCGNDTGSAISTVNVRNLLLLGVTVVNSSRSCLDGDNVSGNSTVVNSTFIGSRFGLMLLNSFMTIVDSTFGNLQRAVAANGSSIHCWGCLFEYNEYGIFWVALTDTSSSYSEVEFINSNFVNCFHGVHCNGADASFFNCAFTSTRLAATMYNSKADIVSTTFADGYTSLLLSKTPTTLRNVTIVRSRNSAIRAIQSKLNMTGNVSINDSYLPDGYGGALYLLSSEVYLLAPSRVVFFNNTAAIGGAVFVSQSYAVNQRNQLNNCFFQVDDPNGTVTKPGVQLVFMNNSAPRGGSAIYADIKNCTLERSPSLNYNKTNPMNVFNAISYGLIYSNSSNVSQSNIQYEPITVIFCETTREDGGLGQEITTNIYPGTATRVWIASVDVYNNLVPTTIFTQTNDIAHLEYFLTGQSCQPYNLPDVIVANNDSTEIYFSIEASDYGVLEWETPSKMQQKTRMRVTKKSPCPSGFTYRTNVCDCNDYLLTQNVVCNISEQSFSAPASAAISWWLGTRDENCTKLIYSSNCPLEYCKTNLSILYASQQRNTRCNFNRSGVICGKCIEGFSETFGEPNCERCEDKYIGFLAMFAALGIALVLLIFALDLTVSEGTINELIFYANMINIYSVATFPSAITVNPFIRFLYVFISWLNLDIGLEICFYNGMDNLQKAWLQFGFSLYLLAIVGIIVLASRHSRRMSALCGRNVLPVLATIIRLTYTKILKNVFSIFEYADIHDVDSGIPYNVWLYDGTIEYMGTSHLLLVIFGAIVTVIFIIPYTTVVLCSPCLLKTSHRKMFSWVKRLTPYFDSYHAPYKNRYRFWTGFLLVIRILVSGVVLSYPDDRKDSMLFLAIVLVMTFTIFIGLRVYKKTYLLILGSFFYLNLIFMCLMSLFIQEYQNEIHANRVRTVVIGIAVGSAFVCFVGILIFHSCKKIAKLSGASSLRLIELELTSIRPAAQPLEKNQGSCELRESLLV